MRSSPPVVFKKELIVLNHESIRNASFSLLPTGYNPEEVDAALHLLAERLASGEDCTGLASAASFPVTDVGYAPNEVDEFFASVAVQIADNAGDMPAAESATFDIADEADSPTEPVTASEDPNHETFIEESDEADAELDSEDGTAYVEAPSALTWRTPSTGGLDLDVLGQAVDRTADTLGSLRSFIDNEIGAMKLAVERQAQDTAKRCESLLAEASSEARALTESVNAEIATARKVAERQIERERRDLAKELKQSQVDCDAEVAKARAAADEYATRVRAEADKDRAEAQRTIENAISMQSSIAESLERARQQLTPSQSADEMAA
jgi:DivIVA domain-containing protein